MSNPAFEKTDPAWQSVRAIDQQVAHLWMVRTFLKHADESEDDEEPQETPEGNEVEVAEVEVEIEEPEVRETDEYIESDYGTKTSMFGMVKKPKMAFIV